MNNTPSEAMAVQTTAQFDLSPKSFEQALTFANYLAESDLVPKDFKGKPGNCLIAMQWGMEIGLKPLQAIQNIAPINGRPTLWGDAMLALVRSSPLCEHVLEDWDAKGTAICRAKRRGEPEQIRTFSDDDAKQAGLLGKQGPWTTGPKRMKQMRARAFALRDVFTDVLRGVAMAEEVMDYQLLPPKDMGQAQVVEPTKPEFYPQEQFDKLLPTWREAIAKGKATAEAVISKAGTKGVLTDDQKAAIRAPVVATQVADVGPKITFANVADAITKATDADKLNDAGTLIGEVSEPEQRSELQAMFDKRETELQGV